MCNLNHKKYMNCSFASCIESSVRFAGRHEGFVLHFTNLALPCDRLYANLHNCLAALQRLIVQCLTALQLDNSRSGLLSRAHTHRHTHKKTHIHSLRSKGRLACSAYTEQCMFYVDAYWINHTYTLTKAE